jgi:hypothetical protein
MWHCLVFPFENTYLRIACGAGERERERERERENERERVYEKLSSGLLLCFL